MVFTLPHPHLHHPHTISENVILWVVGVTVAALAAFAVYQIVDTSSEPVAPAQISSVDAFSPELARVPAAESVAVTGNPAAQSAQTQNFPVTGNPAAQSGQAETLPPVPENSFMGLEN